MCVRVVTLLVWLRCICDVTRRVGVSVTYFFPGERGDENKSDVCRMCVCVRAHACRVGLTQTIVDESG